MQQTVVLDASDTKERGSAGRLDNLVCVVDLCVGVAHACVLPHAPEAARPDVALGVPAGCGAHGPQRQHCEALEQHQRHHRPSLAVPRHVVCLLERCRLCAALALACACRRWRQFCGRGVTGSSRVGEARGAQRVCRNRARHVSPVRIPSFLCSLSVCYKERLSLINHDIMFCHRSHSFEQE